MRITENDEIILNKKEAINIMNALDVAIAAKKGNEVKEKIYIDVQNFYKTCEAFTEVDNSCQLEFEF